MARRATRMKFLSDPAHEIRFASTLEHCSWLNQVENCSRSWRGDSCDGVRSQVSTTSTAEF
jgi:hypothetical protein